MLNKPTKFELWAYIGELLMHSCSILISFDFFVGFKVFSFLFSLIPSFTKVTDDTRLLEED